MKKRIILISKFIFAIVIGVSFYFLSGALKSPAKIKESEAKYMTKLLEAPTDGSKPTEHDATDVVAYAFWKVANTDSFKVTTTGNSSASVATLKISNERIVIGKQAMVSTTSMGIVSIGKQKFYSDDKVLLRDYQKFTDDGVIWKNEEPECISYKEMISRYGWLPWQANGYIICDETYLNKDDIKVEALDNNLYKVGFDLNPKPDYAPFWYRREILTNSSSTIEPNFKSIHIDLTIDNDYRIIYQDFIEVYEVQTYGIKAETKTSVRDEFSYDNIEFNQDYLDYFNKYKDLNPKDSDGKTVVKDDIASMLISSLQNGVNDILLDVDCKIGNKTINGNASINIYDLSNIKIRLKLDDLIELEYLNNNIYMSGFGLNVKGDISNFTEVIERLGNRNTNNNFNEILNQINQAKLVEKGNNKQIDATINVYGIDIKINANLDNVDNGYILNSLSINSNLFNKDISLNIKKGNKTFVDKDYSNYDNISDLTGIINKLLDVIETKEFNFNYDINIFNYDINSINISGDVSVKLYQNNQFDLNLNTIIKTNDDAYHDINIKIISEEYYKNNNISSKGMIFITYGRKENDNKLRIKIPLDDAYGIVETLIKILDLKIDIFDKYSSLNYDDIDLNQLKELIKLINVNRLNNIDITNLIKESEIKNKKAILKLELNENKEQLVNLIIDTNEKDNEVIKISCDNILLNYYSETDYKRLDINSISLIKGQANICPDNNEYIEINDLDEFVNGIVSTATLKDYDINTTVDFGFSIFGVTVDNEMLVSSKIKIDDNNPTIHLSMDLSNLNDLMKTLMTTTKLDVYYQNKYVYIKKIVGEDTYELKIPYQSFINDFKYYLLEYGLGLSNTLFDLLKPEENEELADANTIINEYKFIYNKLVLKLDLGAILNNNKMGIIDLTFVFDEVSPSADKNKVRMITGLENIKFTMLNLLNFNISDISINNINNQEVKEIDITEENDYIEGYNKEINVEYLNGNNNGKIKHKITFVYGLGLDDKIFKSVEGDEITYPTTKTITHNEKQYEILGWYSDRELINEFKETQVGTEDIKLYAKYKIS